MISRGNWRRPPPGPPEINRDLARGITEAHIIGSVPYNALTGVRDDIWDSTNAVSNGGVGRRTTTANTAVKLLSPNNTAAGDFTVIWYGKPEAFGSGYTALWDKGNGGTRENTLFFDTSNAISYVGVGGTHGGWAPGVSVSLNRQNVVILRRSGSTVSACINGKLGSTTFSSSGTSTSSDGFFWMGQNISGGGSSSGAIHNYLLVFNRCITDAEAEQASTDAWFYFRKSPRNLIFIPSAGGGGATGTLAATESGSDTASLAGDVLIDGALASTESGSDSAALTGDVIVQGTLAVTESGTDTAAATGLVLVQGTLAATESGSDTAALAGLVLVQGSLASVEPGADTASIAGDVLVSGAIAVSETGSDTAAFTGDASPGIFGSLGSTESGADTAQVTGLVLIQGGLAATETGSDTAAITGPAAVSGSIAATETGSDTAAVTGLVLIYGSMAATETGSDTADISSFRPTVPGIEYTLPEGKAHYTLPEGRAHYTIAA